MKRFALSIAGVFFTLSLPTFGAVTDNPTTSYTPVSEISRPPFIKTMPDFCQLSQRYGKLPGGGSQYCAPTAISNILVWLDQHGFSNLVPGDDNSCKTQFNLIKILGSESYMNTDRETGTSPIETMEGLERYVKSRGYNIGIEWKGWRDGGKFASKNQLPSIDWLKEGTQGNSNIIISVGWYNMDKKKKIFNRLGGHYVTVVGVDTKKEKNPIIFVHNPSFGSEEGKNPKPQICRLVPIKDGYFGPWYEYSPHPAKGYFRIEGIPMRSDARYAILDGGIRFTVSQHRAPTTTIVNSENSEQPEKTSENF